MFVYPVLARNDLDDSLLQILDLKPNTSLDMPSVGVGQTGYRSDYFQNQAVAVNAGPPVAIDGVTYGLRAYILDRIEDPAGGVPTSVADAATIANAILTQVAAGGDLLAATLNAMVVVVHGAGSSWDGSAGNSRGTVQDLLRILQGEVYRMADGATISDGAGVFHAADTGTFVTTPNVTKTLSHPGGRQGTEQIPSAAAAQTGTQDLTFRNIRRILNTGEVHLSALTGVLSKLILTTFTWVNPQFTYGAGGTALNIAGGVMPTGGAGRALVVYDITGAVI
ncbi:MAG: hypothetical protein Q8P59_14790 [Dehalococcoidia bacterium]|nr:hypothetical protein [Dehalococcoidia bacterium]